MASVTAAVIPKVSRLSNTITRVLGCNPGHMTLQGTNTYILGTGKRRILLDAGDAGHGEYITNLKQFVKTEQIELAHILITHWHHDHIGGVPDVLSNLKAYTENCKVWKYPRAEDAQQFPTLKLEELLNGQEFSVPGATLKVIHSPGHTVDHVAFHLLEENALFSGDCVLGDNSTSVFEDLHDYLITLDSFLDLNPCVLYPGHGNIVTNPSRWISYYIKHRKEREQQIIEILINNPDERFNPLGLVNKIYLDLPEVLKPAAMLAIEHHLQKLLKEEKVIKNQDLWQYNVLSKL